MRDRSVVGRIRPPAVAGAFYPAPANRLAAQVDGMIRDTVGGEPTERRPITEPPLALVVPHAGYRYSGPVAASAYAQLVPSRAGTADGTDEPGERTVAILGPSHFVPLTGLAVPGWTALRTPLGDVPTAEEPTDLLVRKGLVGRADPPHAREHSIEVQLPFLQRLWGHRWRCVPIVAGRASSDHVADCLDTLDGALVVVSTDLSHYLDQQTAQRLDRRTARAVVDLDPSAIGDRDACGAVVLRGLLVWARRHELLVHLLDLRTSADTSGEPARVVGYGAFEVRRPSGADRGRQRGGGIGS